MTTAASTAPASEPELSPQAFDMLMAAVNIARHRQVRTLEALRQKLAAAYPEVPKDVVEAALKYWANYIAKTGAHLR